MKIVLFGLLGVFWFSLVNRMKVFHFKRLDAEGKESKENLVLNEINSKEWLIFTLVTVVTFFLLMAIVNTGG